MAPPIVLLMHLFSGATFPQTGSRSCQDPGYHPCMADPALEGLLSHYQRLGVATSTWPTYQAGIKALHQFCAQYTILPLPSFTTYPTLFLLLYGSPGFLQNHQGISCGIHLEHLERGFEDPTKDELLQLLCTGIPRDHKVFKLVLVYPLPSQFSKH